MSKIFSLGDTVNSKKTRLFLGPNSDHRNIQTYHDPKYKWILDFAEELRAIGNWSKNEIDLSKEKTNYDGLDEAGRHIYEAGLKFAITLDSCAGRGMLQLFNNGGISNNPEWELYITNHQNNELLHSESYTEMVRAIYNDVDDFIESITKDEHIQARATTILKAFDYSNDVFEKNEANNTAKAHGKKILFPEIDDKALKIAIYRAALVVNMFEGIRFFATFVANWSFSEQPVKLMQGSSNIFKLIARDEMIHLDVFQKVINMLQSDKSEGFKEIAKEQEEDTYKMFAEAYEEEKVWIEYLFSKGSPLIGMNAQILQQYMDYIFAVRMKNIGLNPKKIGLSGDTYNPVPWVDNYLDSSNVKSAPQEIESVNYIAAIDNSKDTDFTMDEL
jgi:ribonucleotide reductase beta subunit family protein with ferritin-like domain